MSSSWLTPDSGGNPSPTLSYGYGLEPVQLSQQTGALGRVEAIDELLGSAGRVERFHGLLERMRAQVAPLHQHCGGRRVAAESACGQPGPGSQREGGSQDSLQAGKHLSGGAGDLTENREL